MFKIIHNLYANAKSCVRVGHLKSELSCSSIEVRKGEDLSLFLFTPFLSNFTEFIAIPIFFKLYILLYADDTVI